MKNPIEKNDSGLPLFQKRNLHIFTINLVLLHDFLSLSFDVPHGSSYYFTSCWFMSRFPVLFGQFASFVFFRPFWDFLFVISSFQSSCIGQSRLFAASQFEKCPVSIHYGQASDNDVYLHEGGQLQRVSRCFCLWKMWKAYVYPGKSSIRGACQN